MKMNVKLVLVSIVAAFFAQHLGGQDRDTPIADQSPKGIKEVERNLVEKIRPMIEEKKMLSRDEATRMLSKPVGGNVDLPEAATAVLSKEEVAVVARDANLRVGYCYLCTNCDDWHLNLAGGYAVAADVVATCEHVVNNKSKMREGYLVVADQDGRIFPVKSIIASSQVMDTALLRIDRASLSPSPLNDSVPQGASAYCYSSPLGQFGYFTEGIVNRFFWDKTYEGGDRNELLSARHLRVNFSTDWAPGSSGSAVFDQSGNVIGHVSRIETRGARNNQPMITFHHGIPASAVRLLAESANDLEKLNELAELEKKEQKTAPSSGKGGEDETGKTQKPEGKAGE